MPRKLRLIFIVLLTANLTACVTAQTSPPWPQGSEPIAIKVIPADIGMNDLPFGGYHVEGSPFVVTTGRTVSKTEGAFGLLGALSAQGGGKDEAKKRLAGHEKALETNLATALELRLKARIDQRQGSSLLTSSSAGPGKATLELMPFSYLAVRDGDQTQLQLIVKARLLNARGSEQWKSRYAYYHPQRYPLTGRGGLTENNGQLLKTVAAQAIDETAAVILTDSRGSSAGWLNQPVKATAVFTGIEPFPVEGLLLKKTDSTIIFNPKIGAATFAGVNILPTKEVALSAP